MLGPGNDRELAAFRRLIDLEQTLYQQYCKHGLTEPEYALPRLQNEIERSDPDYVGPIIQDDFPEINFEDNLCLANLGRLVAAMDGIWKFAQSFPTRTRPAPGARTRPPPRRRKLTPTASSTMRTGDRTWEPILLRAHTVAFRPAGRSLHPNPARRREQGSHAACGFSSLPTQRRSASGGVGTLAASACGPARGAGGARARSARAAGLHMGSDSSRSDDRSQRLVRPTRPTRSAARYVYGVPTSKLKVLGITCRPHGDRFSTSVSALELVEYDPTATQLSAARQSTPERSLNVAPPGVGVHCRVHHRPS